MFLNDMINSGYFGYITETEGITSINSSRSTKINAIIKDFKSFTFWIYFKYNKSIRIVQGGDAQLEKFSPKKYDREVTTIRIPKETLEIIDKKSAEYDMSRNEFINQCILYALKNMEENNWPGA